MAYPIWLTPAGNLGIVPEAEYYQFSLDGYDTSGGTLKYSKISGTLPPGLQITATGSIQGIPISTGGPDLNQEFAFTVRLQNLSTLLVADRTFNITVTNVAPPIIVPKTVVNYYNLTLQGTITANQGDYITQQFNNANATVFTSVINSSTITVIYNTDRQFILNAGNLNVVNGITTTLSNSYPITYSIVSGLATRDLGEYFDGQIVELQLEATEFILGGDLKWSLRDGTLPPGLVLSSSGLISGYINVIPSVGPDGDPGWDDSNWDGLFTFDNRPDRLGWDFPLGTISKNFEFTIEVSDGTLTDSVAYKMFVLPKQSTTADSDLITVDTTIINGVEFTVDTGALHNPIIISTQDNVPPQRQGSWFTFQIEAIDLEQDVLNYVIPTLTAGAFDEQSVIGQYPYIARSIVSQGNISAAVLWPGNNTPYLTSGDQIQVLSPFTDIDSLQTSLVWYNATVNNHGSMQVVGNTIITANVGDFISQTVGSANAKITNTSVTTGNISLDGGFIVGVIETAGNLIISANIGDIVTQIGSTGNATIAANSRLSSTLSVVFNSGGFLLNTGNLRINGANVSAYPTSVSSSFQQITINAVVGDIITQPSTGANARVIRAHSGFDANTVYPLLFELEFNSGRFSTGPSSGNIRLNGSNVAAYPTTVYTRADIGFIYNTSGVFRINQVPAAESVLYIDGRNSFAVPDQFLAVGVDVAGSPSPQGSIGFDEDKFDQGALSLPGSLVLNQQSGWITGFLPTQTANETVYDFELIVFKRDLTSYQSSRLFQITVLGDLYNTVDWLTPSYLGTIQNGAVSDLNVVAISPLSKQLYYYYTPNSYLNQVQGLRVEPDGLLSGRASFQLFKLDRGLTTFDNDIFTDEPTTTFDHTFEFSITAQTFDQSASASRIFSILVRERNSRPYENLYLKASLNKYQRLEFRDVTQNQSVFPSDLIYRSTDPWFGLASDVRMLFLPGLNPSTLSEYATAMETNHFQKRLLFTDVKTAVARRDGVFDVIEVSTENTIGTYNIYNNTFVPTDYSQGYTVSNTIPSGTRIGDQTIKYEVVYAEIKDENSNNLGQGPADTIDLSGKIQNPYLDGGNSYVIANPNSFTNMNDIMVNSIGYQDKGVLPDWMTSIQPNGVQLGFVRAVVLAYTNPGAGETIAWRFNELGYNLNEINFVVDRYYIDNVYTGNYDIAANSFVISRETTFDRYPAQPASFRTIASVDYAVDIPFQEINERTVEEINDINGLDGITSFRNGETLIFFSQEFQTAIDISDRYNQGWANSLDPWDDPGTWDFDYAWDPAIYVPGYREWLGSRQEIDNFELYSIPNQRISIWTINIDDSNFVSLSLANVTTRVTSVAANTTGFGSNITMSNTNNLFVGMSAHGAGLSNGAVITDIIGSNIVLFPAVSGTISSITFIPTPVYNDIVFVRNGTSHGGVNVYYDPIINTGNVVPNWSEIPQQIKATGTIFDGNGTKFYDYRDNYVIPQQGEQQLLFPRQNVFN
jgi:hypothetical protein